MRLSHIAMRCLLVGQAAVCGLGSASSFAQDDQQEADKEGDEELFPEEKPPPEAPPEPEPTTATGLIWSLAKAKNQLGVKFEDGVPSMLKPGAVVYAKITASGAAGQVTVVEINDKIVKLQMTTKLRGIKPKGEIELSLTPPTATSTPTTPPTQTAPPAEPAPPPRRERKAKETRDWGKPYLTPSHAAPLFESEGFRIDSQITSNSVSETTGVDGESFIDTSIRGTTFWVRPSYGLGQRLGGGSLALSQTNQSVETTLKLDKEDSSSAKRKLTRIVPAFGMNIANGFSMALAYDFLSYELKYDGGKTTFAFGRVAPTIGYVDENMTALLTYSPKVKFKAKDKDDEGETKTDGEGASDLGIAVRHLSKEGTKIVFEPSLDLGDVDEDSYSTEKPGTNERLRVLAAIEFSVDGKPRRRRRSAAGKPKVTSVVSLGLVRNQSSLASQWQPTLPGWDNAPTTGAFVSIMPSYGAFDFGLTVEYAKGEIEREDPANEDVTITYSKQMTNVGLHFGRSL